MTPSLLKEIRDAAQKRIKDGIYAPATTGSLKADLKVLADGIAEATSSVNVDGPIKAMERATEKVAQEYEGDWYDLKDVVRTSIIAENESQLDLVAQQIRLTCVARNGLGLMKDLKVLPSVDPCGYSGLNFVVVMKGGRPAEIQANTVRMAWGRMREQRFAETFKGTKFDGEQSKIQVMVQVKGGLGHAFYEIYRRAPGSPNALKAAELSKMYYRFVRGDETPSLDKIGQWNLQFAAFRQDNPLAFPAH